MDLTFIVTEACNLRCTYCYQKSYPVTSMPLDVAVSAMESAIRVGADALALTFFGGEPLMQANRIFEILNEARRLERRHGVPVTAKVPTNGVLLDERTIARAREHGLFISLSFDGIRAAQDAGRVQPDGASSYDLVERALDRLVAAGVPFAVYSVITPQNVRWLAASRRFLFDRGAHILVSALDYTAEWTDAALDELRAQLNEVAGFYRELLKQRSTFHLEPFDSRIAQRTRPKDWTRCRPGLTQVTVGPDGSLYGCVEYFYRRLHPLGTAKDWLTPASVKSLSRERAGLPEECGSCGVRERCNNACACVNLRTTGMANRPPLSLCISEQETLFAADRVATQLYREKSPEFLVRQYSASYHLLSGIEKLLESLEARHAQSATRS